MIDPRNVPMKGKRTAALDQARAYVPTDAKLLRIVFPYLDELSRCAHLAGLDFAVLAAQSAHETTSWRSDVWRHYRNPAGMKTADGSDYVRFSGGRNAARAQVVQVCAYVYGDCPKALKRYLHLAPRFALAVDRYGASVGTLAHLGNGRWAEDPDYAAGVARHLAAIRSAGGVEPPPLPPAGLSFVDALSPNRFGRPFRPVAMVWHITDDLVLRRTIDWFLNPASGASSHYVVARDGTIYRCVDPATGSAWTNGDVRQPRQDIPWLREAVASGNNLNLYTITTECVGTPNDPPTEAQYRGLIAIAKYETQRWGISPHRGHQLRHADINSVSRAYCPGPDYDLARIIEAIGGDPTRLDG